MRLHFLPFGVAFLAVRFSGGSSSGESKKYLKNAFEVELDIISIHRPNAFFLDYDQPIGGVDHTYQRKYFRDIKYISDSQGSFRYGHPFDTEEFKDGKTIHLLIHPLWWIWEAHSNLELLQQFVHQKDRWLKQHVSKNCIPYREFQELG